MATWGDKPRGTRSTRSTPAPRAAASRSLDKVGTSEAVATKTADPSGPIRRGDQARAELRDAVSGREHEFIGVAFICGGLLVGLAIYLKLAGILGRVVD